MRDYAMFLNGVYETVLQSILRVQSRVPDCVLYLQPYSRQRIVRLAEEPPSLADPVVLFVSTTDNLTQVAYLCEIVSWEDKRELGQDRLDYLNGVLEKYQPGEDRIYGLDEPGGAMVNLLHVRRLKQLSQPFSVAELVNDNNDQPLSTGRTTSGGWQYVRIPDEGWLAAYL